MKKKLLLLLAVLMTAVVAQAATDYGFTVAGTAVTSDNCNNITSSYITSGTVYYTPSTNTLYMNNVTITMTGDYNRVINNLECSGLKVQFSGTCNLYARDAAVVRIRKTTTLYAPSASTVVNITGVNENGIWMATSNTFSLTIQGPGTFNIKSTNNTAIEDEDDSSGIQLDTWHEVYFDNVNAVLSSGGNSVVKRVLPRFKAGSSVRFKATNNSSYPVINYCGWQLYGNEALLEPYGAYHDGSYVVDSNGNRVYNKDVYVSDDYVAIINATNFPDANFRSWLLENFPGYIHEGHVNNWGVFNLSGKNISNLKGIEYFTNLSSLNISNNNLTSVDLSHNTNLEDLYCSNNQLTSLNLSNLTNLEILDCSNNKLTTLYANNFSYLKTLNCSNNTLLTELYCYEDNLTTLNVTGCTALKKLYGLKNYSLSTITGLANCTALTYLSLSNCALTDMSAVSGMNNLTNLYLDNNRLTTLDVHGKSQLQYLTVYNNPYLTDLKCYNCKLNYLDVSDCPALQELRCYYNANMTTLMGLAECTALTYLDCEDCQISDLSALNTLTNIQKIFARNNKLTSLAVNNKGSLVTLRVSGNTTLTTLNCYRNALTSLNVTGCTGLKDLRCYENANLTTITGLADCAAIIYLDCEDCQISDLSVVNSMTNIQKIYARNNKLTTFAVTGKSDLTYLRVSGNQSLTSLQCANNALTTLDFTNCPALTHASCAGNSLTSLTVTGCTSLKNLFCNRNRISGTAMTNLVNSLPTRTASDPGNFNVLNNTNENNVITAEQLAIARGKNWNPKKWNGSDWVDLAASLRGDVNSDGEIDINDVTRLIDVVLGKDVVYDAVAADCNTATGNGAIDINDVTALINRVLHGSWSN